MAKEERTTLFYRACLLVLGGVLLYLLSPQQIALHADWRTPSCGAGYEFQRFGKPFTLSKGQVFHMSRIEALVNLRTTRPRARLEVSSEGGRYTESSYSEAVQLKPHLGGLADVMQIDITEEVNAPEVGVPGKRLCFYERERIPIVSPDSGVTIRGTLTPPLYRVLSAFERVLGF